VLLVAVIAVAAAVLLTVPLDGGADRLAAAQSVAAPGPEGTGGERSDVDTRLVLQLGMVLALLYVAFVCVWLSRTRSARSVERALHRVGALWSAVLARAGFVSAPPAGARDSASTCAIAWKPGHLRSRFQAVIFTPGDRRRRVVAESAGLRWPPKDARNPPTRELEAALAALGAKVVPRGRRRRRQPAPHAGQHQRGDERRERRRSHAPAGRTEVRCRGQRRPGPHAPAARAGRSSRTHPRPPDGASWRLSRHTA